MRIRSHYRKVKRGHVVVRSHIRLGNPKDSSFKARTAHVWGKNIYIDNFKEATPLRASNVLSHEELHHILDKHIGRKASIGLDYVLTIKDPAFNPLFNIRLATKDKKYIDQQQKRLDRLATKDKKYTDQQQKRLDQKNRKHSYIFLGKPHEVNSRSAKVIAQAIYPHIYLENRPNRKIPIEDVIAHEELHNALYKHVGKKASIGLDNIQPASKPRTFNIPLASSYTTILNSRFRINQYKKDLKNPAFNSYKDNIKKAVRSEREKIKLAYVYPSISKQIEHHLKDATVWKKLPYSDKQKFVKKLLDKGAIKERK